MTRGNIIKAAILPGLWPRLKELFGSGFAHIAYLIAQIYAAVRLLPAEHPYLKPENLGRFGIRHVIAQASNNLVLKRKNIDQIFIFILILMGIFLLAGQFIILIISLINQPALAQATASSGASIGSITSLFGTPPDILISQKSGQMATSTSSDIVFQILDRVFGIPNIFNSCISVIETQCRDIHGNVLFTPTAYPFPLHEALHGLFKYYSQGLMVVGLIVILYFVTTIIGETAVTGTPFGQRFNKAWAPVRLIVFFALITPIGQYGLNGGQYIVLNVAKYSSNFATNGWVTFNKILTNTRNDSINNFWSPERLVGNPSIPELGTFVEFMYTVKVCEALLESDSEPLDAHVLGGGIIKTGENSKPLRTAGTLEQIKEFSKYSDFRIAFGHYDDKINAHRPGHVNAKCGSITLPITDLEEPGSKAVQENYLKLIQAIYDDQEMAASAECFANSKMASRTNTTSCTLPTTDILNAFYDRFQEEFVSGITQQKVIDIQKSDGDFSGPNGLRKLGWAGAGLWYNSIAEMNGAVSTAIYNLPKIRKFPPIMEKVAQARAANLNIIDPKDQYNPDLAGKRITSLSAAETEYAAAMYQAYREWTDTGIATKKQPEITTNGFIDMVNILMGTGGLFAILENQDVNPMAQLSIIGKEMMEAAITGIAITGGAKILGLFNIAKTGTDIVSGFMLSVASISLLMGFMLFYVLPILPFVYFLFAVGGWVKSIFEAMVAVPLWAIAHIRIDGEGLPGRDASNGYYLLLEIFLRPILIVFGLIAAILLFSAMALGLNDIYELVINTAYGGDNPLYNPENESAFSLSYYINSIDKFFYTATYTIMIYIIGTNCFKMIDLVPKSIMRWMGVSVSTFQESMGDPAEKMSGQIYKQANLTITLGKQSLAGGVSDPGKTAAIIFS